MLCDLTGTGDSMGGERSDSKGELKRDGRGKKGTDKAHTPQEGQP